MANDLQQAIKKRRSLKPKATQATQQSNDLTIETLSNTILKYRSTINRNEADINDLREKNLKLKQKCNDMELNYTASRLRVIDLNKQLIMTTNDFQKQLSMLSTDHDNQKSVIDQYQRLSELQKADINERKNNLQYEEMKAKETQLAMLETEVDETDKVEAKAKSLPKTKSKSKSRRKKKLPSSLSLRNQSVKPSKSSKPNAWRM